MTLFAKVHPMDSAFEAGSIAIVRSNTKASCRPVRGDEIIVWVSENVGGQGLCALGIVKEVSIEPFQNSRSSGVHDEYVVSVFVSSTDPQPFNKTDAAPYRDVADGTPISAVSKLAYYYSHRRIKEIDRETANFLRERFLPNAILH